MTSDQSRVWAWCNPARQTRNGHRKPDASDPFGPTSETAIDLIPYVLHQVAKPAAVDMLGQMKLQDQDKSIYSLNEKLPGIDEHVIVVTRYFRCLGYRDEAGTWRHATDGAPIGEVSNWTRQRRP